MNEPQGHFPPRRISDLTSLKNQGADVLCKPVFEIVPVDFVHRQNQYQAYIFLCRYTGTIDGKPYMFRKCYARGCPNNLCQHVAQAVLIANRHLERDYKILRDAGIHSGDQVFTLDQMMVKLDDIKEKDEQIYTIYDFINMAKAGEEVAVAVELEEVPAVEHFDHKENPQTFFMTNFKIKTRDRSYECQRCLGCYATGNETEERPLAIRVANARLDNLYHIFQATGIAHDNPVFK